MVIDFFKCDPRKREYWVRKEDNWLVRVLAVTDRYFIWDSGVVAYCHVHTPNIVRYALINDFKQNFRKTSLPSTW